MIPGGTDNGFLTKIVKNYKAHPYFSTNSRNIANSQFGIIHYALVLVSFMVENTVETQIGANFTIFFCVLPFFGKDKSVK